MTWNVMAAAAKIDPNAVNIPTVAADKAVNGVLNIVYFMAGIICVIVIISAGLMYTTSNGEPEKTKRARNMILYAVVGIIVIMLAFIITNFIIGRF